MYESMFEPLNRSLEMFITKFSKSTAREERSRRSLKKPKSYKNESDGCIDFVENYRFLTKLLFPLLNIGERYQASAQ